LNTPHYVSQQALLKICLKDIGKCLSSEKHHDEKDVKTARFG